MLDKKTWDLTEAEQLRLELTDITEQKIGHIVDLSKWGIQVKNGMLPEKKVSKTSEEA